MIEMLGWCDAKINFGSCVGNLKMAKDCCARNCGAQNVPEERMIFGVCPARNECIMSCPETTSRYICMTKTCPMSLCAGGVTLPPLVTGERSLMSYDFMGK